MEHASNDQLETHPHFPSGNWEGFYLEQGAKQPVACVLEFKQGVVTGRGSDPVGAFDWSGTYDREEGTCTMTKQYLGRHQVIYRGHVDENGIWGQWSIRGQGEGFHHWPQKRERVNQREARKKKKAALPLTPATDEDVEGMEAAQ